MFSNFAFTFAIARTGGQCPPYGMIAAWQTIDVILWQGGTYFFTIVTYQRRPLFQNRANVDLLRTVITSVREEMPFDIDAAVILPNHMHFIWSLPSGDFGYSRRIGKLKVRFTKAFYSNSKPSLELSASRVKHRESDIWQRRFWEHTIRDEEEFDRLFEYIHFNPVKHGCVTCPHKWQATSFHKWVRRGVLDQGWGCSCNGRTATFDFESVKDVVGE